MGRLTNDERLWLAPTRLHGSFLLSPSFDSVQDMTLSCLFLSAFTSGTFQWCFGGSLQRLRKLRLDHPISCPRSLVDFITSFPGLQETIICRPNWTRETDLIREVRVSGLSDRRLPRAPRLRGALYLDGLAQGSGRFFSYLATQMTGFEKVAIGGCTFEDYRPVQSFISSIGTCLKRLHVLLIGDREFVPCRRICIARCSCLLIDLIELPNVTLDDCKALEQIMFSFCGPEAPFPAMAVMLSTVTSRKFYSFVLDVRLRCLTQAYRGNLQEYQMEGIRMFDLPLFRLAAHKDPCNSRKRVFVMVLADNPEPLVLGLVLFRRVGNIRLGGRGGQGGGL